MIRSMTAIGMQGRRVPAGATDKQTFANPKCKNKKEKQSKLTRSWGNWPPYRIRRRPSLPENVPRRHLTWRWRRWRLMCLVDVYLDERTWTWYGEQKENDGEKLTESYGWRWSRMASFQMPHYLILCTLRPGLEVESGFERGARALRDYVDRSGIHGLMQQWVYFPCFGVEFSPFSFFTLGCGKYVCSLGNTRGGGLIRLVSLCHFFWRELAGGDDYHPVGGVEIRAAANEKGGLDIPIESFWMVW